MYVLHYMNYTVLMCHKTHQTKVKTCHIKLNKLCCDMCVKVKSTANTDTFQNYYSKLSCIHYLSTGLTIGKTLWLISLDSYRDSIVQ